MTWSAEESHGGFPFIPGQPFEVIILVQSGMYKIAINGMHFAEFPHRLPPGQVTHLTMDGDMKVNAIIFEMQNQSTTSAPPPMPVASQLPYPTSGGAAMPPYPVGGAVPYPTSGPGYPPPNPTAGYMPQTSYPTAGPSTSYPYSTQPGYNTSYPAQQSQGYPTQPPGAYPAQGGYPAGAYGQQGGYPAGAYGQQGGYPNQPYKQAGILGGLGSGLFGSKSRKSGITPGGVAGIAAGVGAAALGASMLSHAVPVSLKRNN